MRLPGWRTRGPSCLPPRLAWAPSPLRWGVPPATGVGSIDVCAYVCVCVEGAGGDRDNLRCYISYEQISKEGWDKARELKCG